MFRFTLPAAILLGFTLTPAQAEDFMATLPATAPAGVTATEFAAGDDTRARVTPEEVGDADSFGRNVQWIGLLSGFASLQADCSAPPGEPAPENCVTLLPQPQVTQFTLTDIASITIPGRSSRSLFCHWQTPLVTYIASNNTVDRQTMQIRVTPVYRIENEVLNEAGVIDPVTGLPLGGSFEVPLSSVNVLQGIEPGELQRNDVRDTRTCIAGMVSKTNLQATYGLTDAQVRRFFRRPTTITMSLTGAAAMLEVGVINYGTRFLGD